MNKALEQKLIGPMEESIPRNNPPKQFCERCFEQELVLELVRDFFGRKKKCVGAGISGGGPSWAHKAGGAPRG